MSTTSTGREAEVAAGEFLESKGFKILDRNWRTRVCEIDIIAQKKKVVYFVEVKFRATDAQGSGMEYITPSKLRQMRFAAEVWVNENDWRGDYCLSAIEVSGLDFEITDFVELSNRAKKVFDILFVAFPPSYSGFDIGFA